MTASSQTKCALIFFLVLMLLLETTFGIETTSQENKGNEAITLVDVSIGATKDESACIFKINGKTIVVNRHQTETYDDVTIYVQEVYATNTEAQDQDKCKFMYSIAEQTKAKESAVQQEIIGEQTVNFLLGTRLDLEAENIAQAETNGEENAQKNNLIGNAINDNTRVKINGYDVTGLDVREKTSTQIKEESSETIKNNDDIGIFAKIVRFIFG